MMRAGKMPPGMAAVGLCLAVSVFANGGCKRRQPDEPTLETEPQGTTLPPLTLTDDTPDLLMTWIDGRGDAHAVSKPADVPTEGRDQVRIVVTTREAGTREMLYVANLTVKNSDGTYPVTTQPRADWDAMISKRRQAFAAPSAPPETASPEDSPEANGGGPAAKAAPLSAFTVIVYGAAWCGACHEAVAYLKRHKVPVIEKDIEQDPAADTEMRAKLARVGAHGGSIPVIDVKGKILIGFEAHQLDAAIRGASAVAL